MKEQAEKQKSKPNFITPETQKPLKLYYFIAETNTFHKQSAVMCKGEETHEQAGGRNT